MRGPDHFLASGARRAWGVGLAALALAGGARADAVDNYVRERMAREHIPGVSLVVVRHGKILKARGYGKASLELGSRTRVDTVYDLASTTKPFVATAVLLLVQDGKLSLDDRLSQFVAGLPASWSGITVRQLLSQTSGIKDYLRDLRRDFPNDATAEQILKAAAEAPLSSVPGATWEYSNTGYVALGMIVQKVAGKRYDVLLRERVFEPLGMAETRRMSPEEVVAHRTSGYLWYGGAYRNADFLRFLMTNHGDRGLLSTALDLAKWDRALAAGRVLSRPMLDAMESPVARVEGGSSYPTSYGLGWFIKTINGHRQLSHPGGAPGTGVMLSRYPEDGLTVALMTNGGGGFTQAIELGVAMHYVPGLSAVRPVKPPKGLLAACAGYYNAYASQIVTAAPRGSKLHVDDNGHVNHDMVPDSDHSFIAEAPDQGFAVVRDASGAVASAILRLGPDRLPVQRIGPLASSLAPRPDPDPALTRRVESVIRALAEGGQAVEAVAGLAPGARTDYARWPTMELAGISGVTYIAGFDLTGKGIDRHGGRVGRVLYYRLLGGRSPRYVLVYLTAEGLVTDQDVVTE
jgi:D-alanyl-D-alanine carboxypeptidase